MKRIPNKGDYVRSTNHDHEGLITDLATFEVNDLEWLQAQTIQATADQKNGIWVNILCDGGGAALVPLDTVSIIPMPDSFYDTHTGDKYKVDALLAIRS